MANLVFVSQKNQARRLNRFLSRTPAGSELLEAVKGQVQLVFLDWGDKNEPMASDFEELAITLGIGSTKRIQLPGSSLVLTKAKYRDLNNIYDQLLDSVPEIEKAILFSFEGHYAILAEKLKVRGAQLHFVEEGLGSYVHALAKTRVEIPGLLRTYYLALRGLVSPILFRNSNFTFSGVMTRFARELLWGTIGKRIPDRDTLLAGFRDFDYCYSSFPHLAVKLFPNAQHTLTPFATAMVDETEDDSPSQEEGNFQDGDGVFIAQAYAFDEKILRKVFFAALEEVTGRLWIKLHPRTSPQLRESMLSVIADEPRLVLHTKDGPAENLIKNLKPRKVISLTSTTLIHVKELSPASRVLSLSQFAIAELSREKLLGNKRTLRALRVDSEVLEFFPDVVQLIPKEGAVLA